MKKSFVFDILKNENVSLDNIKFIFYLIVTIITKYKKKFPCLSDNHIQKKLNVNSKEILTITYNYLNQNYMKSNGYCISTKVYI